MIGGFELRAFSCTLKTGDGVAYTLNFKSIEHSLRTKPGFLPKLKLF